MSLTNSIQNEITNLLNPGSMLSNSGGGYNLAGNYSNVNSLGQMSESNDPFDLGFANLASYGNTGIGAGQSDGIFGGLMDKTKGFGSILGDAGSLLEGYAAMKNYGLAKDAFGFQKDAYSTDLANKAQMINEQRNYQAKQRAMYSGGSTADIAAAGAQADATGVRNKV